MPKKPSLVDEWIKRYLKEEAPRSKSLIVTVFGDSIAPYTSGIWLGGLIELMAPLGVNERLVRTSAFRLIEEDWLSATREGRRSHYELTPSGTRRFEIAYSRIYTPPQEAWDGWWTMVLVPRNGDNSTDRLELRRELQWEGFASPLPGVLLHPTASAAALRQSIERLGLIDKVIALRAQTPESFAAEPINALIKRCWDMTDVATRYKKFIARFQPLMLKLERASLSPRQAFLLQTLLIHSFRRATLHDPRLPTPMLTPDWPGLKAYWLCRELYQLTCSLAQLHLSAVAGLDISAQADSKLSLRAHRRFGGLIL